MLCFSQFQIEYDQMRPDAMWCDEYAICDEVRQNETKSEQCDTSRTNFRSEVWTLEWVLYYFLLAMYRSFYSKESVDKNRSATAGH